jgi:hypothetical protein
VKAWGYEKLAKLNIPLQVYSETKTAKVTEGIGTAVNSGIKAIIITKMVGEVFCMTLL